MNAPDTRPPAGLGHWLPLLAVLLFPLPALGEHEADHRYSVRGYVLGPDDAPIEGARVGIRMGNSTLGSATVDSSGYYSIRLHLHDSDLGKRLTLRTGESEGVVKVQFTAGDQSTERVHYVNFIGGQLSEGPLSRSRVPPWVYVLGGAVILGVLAAVLSRRMRRAAKRRAAAAAAPRPKGKRRKNKRKAR